MTNLVRVLEYNPIGAAAAEIAARWTLPPSIVDEYQAIFGYAPSDECIAGLISEDV